MREGPDLKEGPFCAPIVLEWPFLSATLLPYLKQAYFVRSSQMLGTVRAIPRIIRKYPKR